MTADPSNDSCLMYGELAPWWPLLSAPADYADEAVWYRDALRDHAEHAPHTVLELGSGGGNNASHLRKWFELTLVDRSADMLRVSKALNPDCEHILGDMRDVRLGREFDAVLIHDAITYMTTPDDLAGAVATAAAHCRPGGAVLFVPDFVTETFRPATSHGGHDAPDGRGLRYLSWTWDPDPTDTTCVVDYAFLLRAPDGQVRSLQDRHTLGMFPTKLWLDTIATAGLKPVALPFNPDADHDTIVFAARKPAK